MPIINVVTLEELNNTFKALKDRHVSAIDVPMTEDIRNMAVSYITPDTSLFGLAMNGISIGIQIGLHIAKQRRDKDELYLLEQLNAKSES